MPTPSLIRATLSWLIKALNLSPQQVPAYLANVPVTPVVDIYQGGWSVVNWYSLPIVGAESLALHTDTLLAADPDRLRLIVGYSLTHAGGATATPLVRIRNLTTSNSYTLSAASSDPAVGTLSWADVAKGAMYWIVAPNHEIRFQFPTTAAGETYDGRMLVADFPAGSNPF